MLRLSLMAETLDRSENVTMHPGYLYVLSNDAMPGLVKIGRTERQPEVRAKELHTTGVPQPFRLEYFVYVRDAMSAESEVHTLLQRRGVRTSTNREFFHLSPSEATQVLESLQQLSEQSKPDFTQGRQLAELASTVQLPSGKEHESLKVAEDAAFRLANIARRGYPPGLKQCADIFASNHRSGSHFKMYWREYLPLARAEAIFHPLPSSNGQEKRSAVGREVAEYVAVCFKYGWLGEEDFQYIGQFLVEGDHFQYGAYIQEIRRYALPPDIRERAENV